MNTVAPASKAGVFFFNMAKDPDTSSGIYLIELQKDNEVFQKVGTTKGKFTRFYQIMKSGYRCKVLFYVRGLGMMEALTIESDYQFAMSNYRYNPLIKFGGYTECFKGLDVKFFESYVMCRIKSYSEIIKNEIV